MHAYISMSIQWCPRAVDENAFFLHHTKKSMTAVADLKPFAETAIDRWCQTIQNQFTKIFFNSLNHQISTNDVLQIFNQIVRQTLSATVFFWWERFRWRLSRLDPSSKTGLLIYLLAFANSVPALSRLSLCYGGCDEMMVLL